MNRDLELRLIIDYLGFVEAAKPLRVFSADFQDMMGEGRSGPVIEGEPGSEIWLYANVAKVFLNEYREPGKDVVVVKPHRIIDAKGRQVWPPTDLDEDHE